MNTDFSAINVCMQKNTQSLRKGTWFEKSKLSFRKSLLLTYSFIHKLPYTRAIHETSITSAQGSTSSSTDADQPSTSTASTSTSTKRILSTSTETVSDFYSYCREVCVWAVETKLSSSTPIGGVGKTVEIDESKFGKRKYHRGRIVEGQWVLGGVCREDNTIFLVPIPDNKRDRQTLEPLLIKHIAPGTTIISDCWRAYDNLGAKGFKHLTVNHSLNFVDPSTGAHTNNIESLWWQIKRQLPSTHTRGSEKTWYMHLCEYMYRHSKRGEPLFEAFVKDASELYNPLEG